MLSAVRLYRRACVRNTFNTCINKRWMSKNRAQIKPKRLFTLWLKRIGFTFFGSLSGLSLYFYIKHRDEQNWRRSFYFWRNVYPIYFNYRYTDWKTKNWEENERSEEFNKLHEKYKFKIYNINYELRGLYIKLAQLAAANIGNAYPQCWVEILRKFEDECPHESMQTIKQIIEEQYSCDFDSIFEYFDPKPLGAASIGQVHYARLKQTFIDEHMTDRDKNMSKEIVIKIQYPTAETLFRGDLLLTRKFAAMAQPEHLVYIDEMEMQFKTEFDYIGEAKNLLLVGNEINGSSEWNSKFVIPKPYIPLCTKYCLIMEHIKGDKLITAIINNTKAMAVESGLTMDEFIEINKEKHYSIDEIRSIQTKLKFKNTVWNVCANAVNYSFGLFCKDNILEYNESTIPLNIEYLLNEIAAVHAYELFNFGSFNGDCHPGNILFCDDGRMGLIDYGQVKTLSLERRIKLAKMIVYLRNDDSNMIIQQIRNMGFKSKYNDETNALQASKFYFDSDCAENTNGMNFLLFMEELNKRDPVVHSVDDYVFVIRMRMLMNGLFYSLGYQFFSHDHWYPYAKRILDDNNINAYNDKHN